MQWFQIMYPKNWSVLTPSGQMFGFIIFHSYLIFEIYSLGFSCHVSAVTLIFKAAECGGFHWRVASLGWADEDDMDWVITV